MRSILKALGLTIWGSIAIGVLAILVFVGYETAIRHRSYGGTMADDSTSNDRPDPAEIGSSVGIASSASMGRTNDLPRALLSPHTPEATRQLLLDAVRNSKYESATAYGQQLADANSAAPGDLSIIAQSYSAIGECENARLWAQRAQNAFQAAGVAAEGSLRGVLLCCGPGLRNYELAIVAIERGLKKGGIVDLAEAYVYLGRSKVAVGDIEGARDAFSKLTDVPGISPRVLRLWTLYAETQLAKSENWKCPTGGRTDNDSSSTSANGQSSSGR